SIRLWNTATGQPLPTLRLSEARPRAQPQWTQIGALDFTPDGKALAVATAQGDLQLWHTIVARAQARFAGHKSAVQALALAPDGKSVATGGFDRTVTVWNVATGKPVRLSGKWPAGPVLGL